MIKQLSWATRQYKIAVSVSLCCMCLCFRHLSLLNALLALAAVCTSLAEGVRRRARAHEEHHAT